MADFIHQDEREEQKEAGQKVIDAYRRLFTGSDAGIVLADLIKICKVFQGTEGDVDEGKRIIGLYILRMSEVEAKFTTVVEMI